MEAEKFKLYSVEEYLEAEKTSEVKREYVNGVVHAMAGASLRQNRISLNIASALMHAAKGGPCRVYAHDAKLRIQSASKNIFYYPDVMVGCDRRDKNELFLDHPSIIFEILSSSAEQTDRREKWLNYQTIDVLGHYVIVDQAKPEILWYRRKGKLWEAINLPSLAHDMQFGHPDLDLAIAEIYEGVEFDP